MRVAAIGAGARLPTEAERETAVEDLTVEGNFVDAQHLQTPPKGETAFIDA
jgi:formylglycine-generating enzyme required for sulfatase activity